MPTYNSENRGVMHEVYISWDELRAAMVDYVKQSTGVEVPDDAKFSLPDANRSTAETRIYWDTLA